MKTETKHTPGPWRTQDNSEQSKHGRRITVHASSGIVADIDWNTPSQNIANARLIAAAPALLEALKLTLATLERVYTPPKPGIFSSIAGTQSVARAAIASATGETGKE